MLTKKTILGVGGALVLSSVAAANVYAASQGAYVGGQLGWGKTNQSFLTKSNFSNSFSDKDKGLAGRVFAGYQFDPTYGVELGVTKFSTTNVKGSSNYSYHFPSHVHPLSGKYTVSDKGTVSSDALDLVGKATVPVSDKVSVYGKAGVAYVMDRFSSTTTYSPNTYTVKAKDHENKLLPTVGVGASYNLTSNISADVGYDRIQKVGNTKIGSSNLVGLGMTYHFE